MADKDAPQAPRRNAGRTRTIDRLLPYNDRLDGRDPSEIDLVVLHCTELPTLAMARGYAERILYEGSGTGASGHYYVDRDGQVYRYVRDERIAHHCVGYNARSIGIEMVNRGRYPDWFQAGHQAMTEPYEDRLIEGLLDLLAELATRFPRITALAAHADLDRRRIPAEDDPAVQVSRRLDPGPQFPWDRVLAHSGLTRLVPA